MISGIVTMALALGASAADCDNDVTAVACRSFKSDADFQVEQHEESGNDQIYDIKAFLPYNRALMAVTTAPWDKLADDTDNKYKFGQKEADGCVFFESKNGNPMWVSLTKSAETVRSGDQGGRHICKAAIQYGCNNKGQKNPADKNADENEDKWPGTIDKDGNFRGGVKGRDGLIHATNRVTLNHLVNGLNTLGAFDMYYHRVQANPISSVSLKWIAENACKVSMPVSFQCTGSDCVEVQNIVCASFAGIDARDFGVVSIECKVPPTKFHINSWQKECRDSDSQRRDGDQGRLDGVTSNQAGGNGAQQTNECLKQNGVEYRTPDHKFQITQVGGHMRIGNRRNPEAGVDFQFGAQGANQACSGGTCAITVKSKKAIPQDTNIDGSVSIHADVKSLNQVPRKWSEKLNHFHTAEFNLTRESAPEKVLEMPIGVNFYTDHCDQDALNKPHPSGDDKDLCTDRSTVARVAKLFGGGIDSVPFLSNQEVNLGRIKKNVHGYFRLVAKVNAKNTWFLKRAITALEVSVSGVDDGDFKAAGYNPNQCGPIQKNGKDKDTNSLSNTYKGGVNTDYHKRGFPVAFLVCPKIMAGAHAAAGNVLRFSISWSLASLVKNDAGYTGKAQLLQDAEEADPNAQSVEVQVTIQLGGGETNITTGTAEGAASADNTVTYIIIAVCVIAAALILAVVVVAFMCLRNRSQEQLVAMSPKQATVAAVYDISAPKKGDVMDV